MDSKDIPSNTESELNLHMSPSSSSATSEGECKEELPEIRRTRKESDLRFITTKLLRTESMESQKGLQIKQAQVLWRCPKPGVKEVYGDDWTVTFSVLKTFDEAMEKRSQTLGRHSESADASANRDKRAELGRSSSHPLVGPVKSLKLLSEEAFVQMTDIVRAPPSFDIRRDVNGKVDLSDLLQLKSQSFAKDFNNAMTGNTARRGLKKTNPLQNIHVIGNNDVYPKLLDGVANMKLDALKEPGSPGHVGNSPPSDESSGKMEFGDKVDEDFEGISDSHRKMTIIRSSHASSELAESAARSISKCSDDHLHPMLKHATAESNISKGVGNKDHQDTLSSRIIAKAVKPDPLDIKRTYTASCVSGKDGGLSPAEAASCPDLYEGSARSTSPIPKSEHISFLLRSSKHEIPSAANPNEGEEGTIQAYTVNTKKQKADNSVSTLPTFSDDEQAEVKTDLRSDSELDVSSSSYVSARSSTSMLEMPLLSGSSRLFENLPEYGQSLTLPTPQELPMESGLCEWDNIVKILALNEATSVERVLSWLDKMTTKRYQDVIKLYHCGLYDKVLYLMVNQPDSPLIQNLTMKLIAEMCILPECRLQIIQNPGMVLMCITLLEDDNSSHHFHECSAKILSSIGQDRSTHRALLQEDMIGVLLRRIMNSPDPDVRCNCLELLIRLANNEATIKLVLTSRQFSLEVFSALIDSRHEKIQLLALGMWELLTRYETGFDFQADVLASGIPELVIQFLQTKTSLDFSHLAARVICNIAKTPFGLSILQHSGAIKFLIDFVDQPGNEGLISYGLDIVLRLSMTMTGRSTLMELEVPYRLVKYLKYDEDLTLERTCAAIVNVCQHMESLIIVVAYEPVEDLIRLIYEVQNSSQLKHAAARALFELAGCSETICRQITELHLVEVLHYLIKSGFSHTPTLVTVSDTIRTIAQYPELNVNMIDDESIACLLNIIQGNCHENVVYKYALEDADAIRIVAMQCLQSFMLDPLCRKIFSKAYGVNVLLGSLRSRSILVKQETALLIHLAAQDLCIARQMVIAGVIQRMKNDTAMMIACPAWEKALTQIYDHHLPSKFAYCNRLEINDVTVDGFFIAATAKGKIETLDNLLRDRSCPLDTIYVCKFQTDHPKTDDSVSVLMHPKWQPYVRNPSYPVAFADLGVTSVAKSWQRKAAILYGDLIRPCLSQESLESDEEVTAGASATLGWKVSTQTSTSILSDQLKDKQNKNRGISLTSVPQAHDSTQRPETEHEGKICSLDKYGICPVDKNLGNYLSELLSDMGKNTGTDDNFEVDLRRSFLDDKGLVKAVGILAKFVARKMSGPTGSYSHYTTTAKMLKELVWELKERDELNILPLGHLNAGLHLERALLFKTLADRIGLPCSLVRGEYGIAFNEICIPSPKSESPDSSKVLKPNYVVDVMHNVGGFYSIGSYEATEYCKTPYSNDM